MNAIHNNEPSSWFLPSLLYQFFYQLNVVVFEFFFGWLEYLHSTWEAHLCHIKMVLQRVRDVNLKLNPTKCIFATKNLRLLRHIIGRARTKPNPKNVKVVIKFPIPRTITNVQAFSGLTKYDNNYSKGYEWIMVLFFELTKHDFFNGIWIVKRLLKNWSKPLFLT